MKALSVWAPAANTLSLHYNGKQYPMAQLETGWWRTDDLTPKAGDRYGYIVDGKGPFPDPRSLLQPDGVHGLSAVYDHSTYVWHDKNWRAPPIETAIIYELHIGTFTEDGTFTAAISRLDDLVALGITHVELMPVVEFSGDWGWGYDGVDLFAPHHAYGTPDELKRLVDACHQKGLAVLLDVVYNHLGPTGNYLAVYGPYFTDRYHTPWGDAVNFDDTDSDQVRRFFIDNALMWLSDYHFDGLRLDAIHAIYDRSAIHFLKQLATEVQFLQAQARRPLALIAESDLNDPRVIRSIDQGGLGMHAQWSDDFHHALHALLTQERAGYYADFGQLTQLAKALRQGFVYDGCYSAHRRRCHGDSPDGLHGYQFLGYLQTHDQVGNRARGERSSHLLSTAQLKIGAALVLTAPFIPMLFQGEEWGASTPFLYFTNHREPDLAEAVIQGRQSEFSAFGWQPDEVPNPQAISTFSASKLNWLERSNNPHKELLEWHQALIQLRKVERDLNDGNFHHTDVECNENEGWLWMRRGRVNVCCNFSQEPRALTKPAWLTQHLSLASKPGVNLHGETLRLPAHSVAILLEQHS